ncbi:callose synthase 3-like [Dorcoceras hygrometricum]|uniref:Callose synthase 3-like n=1 Tax=Dorcoceras hygrometricum TaxID=472368 RepID=A0A2Z7DD03_9LAMI|nr:callose synthase 3-like [Dorcoceras hygrometricum]
MGNSSAYVSAIVGSRSIEKTVLLTSASSHMFRGNSDACVSATVESLTIKKIVLLTSFHLIVFNGNRSAYEISVNRFLLYTIDAYLLTDSAPSRETLKTDLLSAKILSMKTVNTYIATPPTIDAREEQGMVIDPTPAVATIKSPAPKRKSRKRRLVLSTGSDDETVGTQEIVKDADAVAVTSIDEADKVLEETLELGINTHASATIDFTMFTDSLEDLRSSIFQRIHDSNCEILSKVNAVELCVRGDLLKLQVLLRQSLENACRVLERQGTTQATQINDLKKGLMAPVGTIFQDLFDIKKKQREQDAKLIALDGQIAAIRSEQLDFQTKIAADILSLSTQVGDIADYIRGGDAKKGEIGSSSRPSTVRTQTFPPTTGTFAERAEQARRHIIESGQVISIEEAVERVIEADRREYDRLERERERERRERRQSRSGTYKRRRGY